MHNHIIDTDEMHLQISVVDNIPWFSTLSHQNRMNITKKLQHYVLPQRIGEITGNEYHDYLYVVDEIREDSNIKLGKAYKRHSFQKYDGILCSFNNFLTAGPL